jgi:hypothetical protein
MNCLGLVDPAPPLPRLVDFYKPKCQAAGSNLSGGSNGWE